MSILNDLLVDLEYDKSPYYRTDTAEFEPETAHLFRAARKEGVCGVYVFQTSSHSQSREKPILPARPAVYVAEARTENDAKRIHRTLWNLAYAPFLIVVLGHQIRIYTGFDYSEQSVDQGRLDEPGLSLKQIRDLLRIYFSAEAIDTGRIWKSRYGKALKAGQRVDRRLLDNLKKLSKVLRHKGLQLGLAHTLIGKYVYIYFLRHRNILSDKWLEEEKININTVMGRSATVEGLCKLDEALKKRFFTRGGDIFPLYFPKLRDEHVELVAGVFKGDKMTSEGLGEMHLDFQAYQFQHIPIELLSSIYEQFLHEQGDGKKQGAIYTPEILADYLLHEVHSAKPLKENMKILDPACGSGIFLVLAYRRLIEKRIRDIGPNAKLSPQELSSILQKSIYGVERQLDACYLTEFSLILTLLHYVHPPDLDKNRDFKFPTLHNEHIFECDFFDDESKFWQKRIKFDCIIGNPPWVRANPQDQPNAYGWIEKHKEARPVADKRVVEAFSWRVVDLLQHDGIIGLVHHATSLHSAGHHAASRKYREAFFKAHEVLRITNFANLRDVLFYGISNQPAVTIVYRPSSERLEKPYIAHYGPFSINQDLVNQNLGADGKLWTITINENEIKTVSPYEAEGGKASLWKFALWGTHQDKQATERLRRLFPNTLDEFCKGKKWGKNFPLQGVELLEEPNEKNPIEKLSYRPELSKRKVVNKELINQLGYRFSIPRTALVDNVKCYVRRGEDTLDRTTQAPHLVLSGAWNYFIYSDDDFIVKDRSQLGIGADWSKHGLSENDRTILRALAVYLSSSLVEYYLFFQCPEWAVSGLHKESRRVLTTEVRKIPTPNFTSQQVQELAEFQRQLADEETQGVSSCISKLRSTELQLRAGGSNAMMTLTKTEKQGISNYVSELQAKLRERVDDKIFGVLKIPKDMCILASEFVRTRLPLDGRPSTLEGIRISPTTEDLTAYAHELREELDDFVMGHSHHKVTVHHSKSLIRCVVEIKEAKSPIPIEVKRGTSKLLAQIRDTLKEQYSQWIYVQRGLRVIERSIVQIYKTPRLIDWTRSQAMNDANEIIGEVLSRGWG